MPIEFRFDQSDIASRYDLGRKSPAGSTDFISQWLRTHAPDKVHRAIDLGCGTGRFSAMLAEAFDALVLGIDLSSTMLGVATSKPFDSRVQFLRGSATNIPVASGGVDIAFVSQVLHHLPNLQAAMREVRRILKPGGRLFIRQTTRANLDSYFYQRFFPEARAIDERRLPSREQLNDAATAADLSRATPLRTVSTEVASSSQEYIEKVSTRTYSDLAMITDASFSRGLEAFARYADANPNRGWTEDVDYLVFAREA